MVHDFVRFPELTNSQMDIYYFESPHKQITEDFRATVVKVTDGDTVRLETDFRDFTFPLRFLDTNSPEKNELGFQQSKDWLEDQILDQDVDIVIDSNKRVGKFGRLLGRVMFRGLDIGQFSIDTGHSTPFDNRREGQLTDLNKELNTGKWF